MGQTIPLEVRFPVSEAIKFSIESIRKRFTRALITAASVVLGIAFYSALNTMSAILLVATQGAQTVEAYQRWMAVISLIVCAVGILNSMLMSVTERTKEIGTMKCLGAMNSHILIIFLWESALLGLLGGLIGSVAGWAAGIGISYFQYPQYVMAPELLVRYAQTIGESLAIAMILSVGATLYPAYHAASLEPAVALRFEI
jgi:predicted lysophospholipase L1 biosynthesis ABC-type transport system permease subunit